MDTMKRILNLRFNWRERVLTYLRRVDITLVQLGEEMGCSCECLSQILRGDRPETEKYNMETICAAIAQIEGRRKENDKKTGA